MVGFVASIIFNDFGMKDAVTAIHLSFTVQIGFLPASAEIFMPT